MFNPALKSAALAGLLACTLPVCATAGELEFEGKTWTTGDFDDSDARVEDYLGRTALYLGRNFAGLPELDLGARLRCMQPQGLGAGSILDIRADD